VKESWQDPESWSPDTDTAPAPSGWATDLNEHAIHCMTAIRALGVLKPGEKILPIHAHWCPYPKNYEAQCTCPGGPELFFADWNTTDAWPSYEIVDRFIERH